MKSKSIIIAAMVGSLAMVGCDDFLTQTNSQSLNQETFFDSDEALSSATAPLYNHVWNSFNSKFYYSMGDGRSNNITATWSDYIYPYANLNETALSPGLSDAWGSLYSVVAQSNNTINNIQTYATSAVSQTAKEQAIAEARFMRGTAYWYLASLWGQAIIYENTADLIGSSIVPAHSCADVMEFAIRDLEYAAKYLPEVADEKGRLTTFSAFGMLSRVYLSMAGLVDGDNAYDQTNAIDIYDETRSNRDARNTYYLDLAKKAALKAMEGPYALMDKYGDLFTYENNNCQEALFQLQWLTGTTDEIYGCNQAITTFFGWSTMVSHQNWGGATYASWDLVNTYLPADTIRRHETIAYYGDYYAELNIKNGGYTVGVSEDLGNGNRCNIKKYVNGTHADNGISYEQSSGLNTHMLRLAEVYLNYTEASMGNAESTSDVQYFNLVRQRAGMPTKAIVTYEDLRYERRIEFAMEGQYWYDLIRRAYYRPIEVINYMNTQRRNAPYAIDKTLGVYTIEDEKSESEKQASTAVYKHLFLPVSDTDKGKNPALKNALEASFGSYEFTEEKITDLYE